MECAVMKHRCLVAIVLWLIAIAAVGHGLTKHSPLPLHTKGRNDGNIPATLLSDDANVCQDGFTLLASEKCYLSSCTTDTWDGALATCHRMGATLAYPLNATEEAILLSYLKSQTFSFWPWLGGSDTASEGNWVWADDNSSIVYSNWSPGQPDNHNNEDCLHYRDDGDEWRWNDVSCDQIYTFVCQQL